MPQHLSMLVLQVKPAVLSSVLVAYANSIDHVFYFVAAVAGMGGIVLWGMGWQDLSAKP